MEFRCCSQCCGSIFPFTFSDYVIHVTTSFACSVCCGVYHHYFAILKQLFHTAYYYYKLCSLGSYPLPKIQVESANMFLAFRLNEHVFEPSSLLKASLKSHPWNFSFEYGIHLIEIVLLGFFVDQPIYFFINWCFVFSMRRLDNSLNTTGMTKLSKSDLVFFAPF